MQKFEYITSVPPLMSIRRMYACKRSFARVHFREAESIGFNA